MAAMPDETYTHGHHESVLRSHTWRTPQNSATYLLDHLRPGLSLLDIGCGPGTITVGLAALVSPARVVGLDAAPSIIEQARALSDSVVWRVGNAYSLDADLRDFDVVHAHQVLQHLKDPVAGLREWGRACRQGGIVAARDADYEAFTWYPQDPLLDRWLELYRAAARANGGEPDAGRRLLAWAHEAGFEDVKATASVWCFATADERTWWASLWADRMTQSAVGSQLVGSGESSVEELRAIADAWRRWAAHTDGWFLVPHGEIIART
jgi:ubiquinone/menaquinone biosynthesis C-methylase UbiE